MSAKRIQAVLLCALVLSALAAVDLGYNFFASLAPDLNGGPGVRGVLAPLLFGGAARAQEGFLRAFVAAAGLFGALLAANAVCAAARAMAGRAREE